jgi:hypothetical protein
MSAIARQRKRRAPQAGNPAPSTTPIVVAQSTAPPADFDYDRRVVGQVDWSIWRALDRGEFRLAVRCRRCGRWLTAGASKRNGMGTHCAAKAGP